VRQEVHTLTAQQLDSLKQGVSVMRARPVSDPTSWSFQANIHGVLGPPASPLFNQCEHGTIQFLTWHRGYLYYFERILRAASGDPSLALPYWDWTAHPSLPEPFRLPADASNSLYEASRFINDASALPAPVVSDDLDTALAMVAFESGFTGFSPSLEGSPHGAVHVLIGGLMGSVPTAANDPIFWLHHCNIDRIWNQWLNLGGGRANPSDASFLDQPYQFADENGQTVAVTVGQIISSAVLGYRYDSVPNPAAMRSMAMAAPAALRAAGPGPEPRTVATSVAPEQAAVAARDLEARPLGYAAETVKLSATPDGAEDLRAAVAAADPARAGRIVLVIEGITFSETPAYTYEVLLNAGEGEPSAAKARAHHAGTINFFGREHRGHAAHAPGTAEPIQFDQHLDVAAVVSRLRESRQWSDEDLSVTIRPITPTPPAGKEDEVKQRAEASAARAKITYRRVSLRVAR
jgi:tyrosinase